MSNDEKEKELAALEEERRTDGRVALSKRWQAVEDRAEDGAIAYEIWVIGSNHQVCVVVDAGGAAEGNMFAKRDAEHIVKLHNATLTATADNDARKMAGGLLKQEGYRPFAAQKAWQQYEEAATDTAKYYWLRIWAMIIQVQETMS